MGRMSRLNSTVWLASGSGDAARAAKTSEHANAARLAAQNRWTALRSMTDLGPTFGEECIVPYAPCSQRVFLRSVKHRLVGYCIGICRAADPGGSLRPFADQHNCVRYGE